MIASFSDSSLRPGPDQGAEMFGQFVIEIKKMFILMKGKTTLLKVVPDNIITQYYVG